MELTRSPRSIAVLVIVIVLVTAGCLSGTDPGADGTPTPTETATPVETDTSPEAEEILQKMLNGANAPDSVHGTQVIEVDDGDGDVERTTLEVDEQAPDRLRMEVVEVTGPDTPVESEGDIIGVNGTTLWSYDAEENTVHEVDFDDPIDDGTSMNAELWWLSELAADAEVEYDGTDSVADRDVHALSLVPNESDDGAGVAADGVRLWIDDEHWYPIQIQFQMETDSEEKTETIFFEEIEFDADIDDDRFSPPEDAEVDDPLGNVGLDSVEEADEHAPFDVPEPTIPDEYQFDDARVIGEDGDGMVWLSYVHEDDADSTGIDRDLIEVVIEQEVPETEIPGETVEIGDVEGTISETDFETTIVWECDGLHYMVVGNQDTETLIEVAESIGCE